MDSIKLFSGFVGFYTLTPDGQLGTFKQGGEFVVDGKLTKAFEEYNRQFLMKYLQNPMQGNFRLAIVYSTKVKQPWGSETLLLEKSIVRRLYPVAGMTAEVDLTTFQKKNREKSIYRGMEIFLEYKDTASPDLPVFCPVLYDRGTRLNDYARNMDRTMTPEEQDTRVVEILNIVAAIPTAKRHTSDITILKEKIYNGIIKKDVRKSSGFALIDDIRRNAEPPRDPSILDPYSDVDKRSDRQVSLKDSKDKSTTTENTLIKSLGSTLVGKPQPAEPQTLKLFARFRDYEIEKLEILAKQCLVYCVPPGTKLLDRGTSDTWNLYLIDGTVELTAADGVSKKIDGGTPTAANPISALKPRMYSVSSVTRVVFLWIDDKLIEVTEKASADGTPSRRASDFKLL